MFGRAGRDGQQSTVVLLYNLVSLKRKTIDRKVHSLITSKECIRKKFCAHLESSFNSTDQGDNPC